MAGRLDKAKAYMNSAAGVDRRKRWISRPQNKMRMVANRRGYRQQYDTYTHVQYARRGVVVNLFASGKVSVGYRGQPIKHRAKLMTEDELDLLLKEMELEQYKNE